VTVNKSVFSYLRLLTTCHCSPLLLTAMLRRRRYLVPAGPTAANPPQRHAAVDRWDRPTGRRTHDDRICRAREESNYRLAANAR